MLYNFQSGNHLSVKAQLEHYNDIVGITQYITIEFSSSQICFLQIIYEITFLFA